MRRIRLLYVTSSLNSVHEHRILSQLAADPEVDVTVASCGSEGLWPGIADLEMRICMSREHSVDSQIPGLRRACSEYRHWRFVPFLKDVMAKADFDIVHSGWLTWDSYEVTKTGFHPHLAMSWGSDVLNNPDQVNPHTSRRLRRRLKRVAHGVDAIYSDANHVAETIVELTGVNRDKISVFPQLGIDTSVFTPSEKLRRDKRRELGIEESLVLLGMRSMRPVYGVESLIRSTAVVAARYPNVRLLLLGDGYLRKSLERLAGQIGMRNRIDFLGAVKNDELPSYLNAADLYVSTSLSDGSSLSLLEAMSCGLPVAVTDVPSNLEWVSEGENGWIAGRGDTNSIAEAIMRGLLSDKQRLESGRMNRTIAEKRIDINANYGKLKQLYCDMLSGASKRGHRQGAGR